MNARSLVPILLVAAAAPALAGPYADKGKPPEEHIELDRSEDLRAPDTDADGIRDDIQAFIDKTYLVPAERRAMHQVARAMQAALVVDLAQPVAVRAVSDQGGRAVNCLYHFAESALLAMPGKAMREIELMTTNSRSRLMAYQRYVLTISGSSPQLPSGDTCDPDPAQSSR